MLQFEKSIDIPNTLNKYIESFNDTIFFDIETTGLHHKYSYLYLIGALYQDNGGWTLKQWFAIKPTDEPKLLKAFVDFINPDSHLIHYNGDSFDLPYVRSRCEFHEISTAPLDNITSLDLYRCIRPYQKMLGLESMAQKSIEQFINIHRNDPFSGKELINVYKEYLQSSAQNLLEQLLLHNQEDVQNMSALISLIAYPFLFNGHYCIDSVILAANELVINLSLEYPIIHPITYDGEIYSIAVNHNTAVIKVPLYHGTLKHYYAHPKDYYYLPAEDKAIHKSVATYVDREHRIPATADNCYQKITGTFIPQYEYVVTPVFSTACRIKPAYFSCDNLDYSAVEEWRPYIDHLLQTN